MSENQAEFFSVNAKSSITTSNPPDSEDENGRLKVQIETTSKEMLDSLRGVAGEKEVVSLILDDPYFFNEIEDQLKCLQQKKTEGK